MVMSHVVLGFERVSTRGSRPNHSFTKTPSPVSYSFYVYHVLRYNPKRLPCISPHTAPPQPSPSSACRRSSGTPGQRCQPSPWYGCKGSLGEEDGKEPVRPSLSFSIQQKGSDCRLSQQSGLHFAHRQPYDTV
jgi:hypothetical protein